MRMNKYLVQFVFLFAFLHIIYRIFNWETSFQDGENFYNFLTPALRFGKSFSIKDFLLAFDSMGLDGDSRPRFLSYLLFVISEKTRLGLWQTFLPHPSFSPVWGLSIVATPLLFYKLIRKQSSVLTALASTTVLISSVSYLYPITYFFHPGKTVVSLAWILAVFNLESHKSLNKISHKRFLLNWLMIGFFSFFLDETAVFIFITLLVFTYKDILNFRKTGMNSFITLMAPVPLIFVIVFWVVPIVTQSNFGWRFDFLSSFRNGSYQNFGGFDFKHLALHTSDLVATFLLPWDLAHIAKAPIANFGRDSFPFYKAIPVILLVFFGSLFFIDKHIESSVRKNFRQWLVLLLLFFVFQSNILSHHPLEVTPTGFHYGSLFGVLFAYGFSICFEGLVKNYPRILNLALIWIVSLQLYNFSIINQSFLNHIVTKSNYWHMKVPPTRIEYIAPTPPLEQVPGYQSDNLEVGQSKDRIQEAWKNWKGNPQSLFSLGNHPFRKKDTWLIYEMDQVIHSSETSIH